MHDPLEGVAADGTIRTGARLAAVGAPWWPVLRAAVDAVQQLDGSAPLYVYGSVATGRAVVPTSDVDLLTIDVPAADAARIGGALSERFADRCREVAVAPAGTAELTGDGDAAHGLRVFLRHYCVHLAGDDPAAALPAQLADARAARGFNGDVGRGLQAWSATVDDTADVRGLATRVARKTLLAVAGLVSVRDGTWSTDRRACARRWDELQPDVPVDVLVAWLDEPTADRATLRRVLRGTVTDVVRLFEAEIGLWDDAPGGPGTSTSQG